MSADTILKIIGVVFAVALTGLVIAVWRAWVERRRW